MRTSDARRGRDTKVIAIDCKKPRVDRFPLGPRDRAPWFTRFIHRREADRAAFSSPCKDSTEGMPRIIAGAFAGTARSTCRVPRQNLGHRESAGWPVSVRALFLFYLKNYHLHRRKSFHDKDTIRSLRGARNRRVRCDGRKRATRVRVRTPGGLA